MKKLKATLREIFSDGEISSTRLLMYLFSVFVSALIWMIVRHLLSVTDPAVLAVWLGAMPYLIAAFIALIAAPYTVNKGAGTISDLFNAIKNMKKEGPEEHS